VSAYLYLEGGATGADSKTHDMRCREGFRALLDNCGFGRQRRMPRLVACGGANAVRDHFMRAHANNPAGDYIAMWLDSEEPMADIDAAWTHLHAVRGWEKPAGASDHQVLFMTTCMETWIVADIETLKRHYGSEFQDSALPPAVNLESRPRHEIQSQLFHATRACSNRYVKGKRSFAVFKMLVPEILESRLPSFRRVKRILSKNL